MTQRGMRKERPSSFEHVRRQHEDENAPLIAARMRPRTLQEYVGQRHLLGEGHVLERAIRTGLVPSMVLGWGPPGTGKTTLARLVAGLTKSHFIGVSAVTSGVADLRQAVEEAREIDARPKTSAPSSLSTRCTASTRRSRTPSSPTSRTAP